MFPTSDTPLPKVEAVADDIFAMMPPLPSFAWPTAESPSAGQPAERPFGCPVPYCGGRFHRKFTLHEHMKTHTGEKPHACPIATCGKRFSTSGNLARHKRLHTLSKLKCPVTECTRIFTKKEKLIRHLKVHMGTTTHTCQVPQCSKTFSTAGNLTRHMKSQHPTVSIVKPAPSSKSSAPPSPASSSTSSPVKPSSLPQRFFHHTGMQGECDAATSALSLDAPPAEQNMTDHEIMELLDCLFEPASTGACHSLSNISAECLSHTFLHADQYESEASQVLVYL
ncbi:Zinc finger protein 76, partial [Globisporangium splendens]